VLDGSVLLLCFASLEAIIRASAIVFARNLYSEALTISATTSADSACFIAAKYVVYDLSPSLIENCKHQIHSNSAENAHEHP
jgi:hypothetical protein